MGTTEPNVLSINLVLVGVDLLAELESFEGFRRQVDPDLEIEFGLSTEMPSGVTTTTRRVNLNRERIVLELSPSRSSITREFPADRNELTKLTTTAQSAIEGSGLPPAPSAFGFNIELVYDQDSGQPADRYLGSRLFGASQLGKQEWTLAGGTGNIVFTDEDGLRRWTVNVRPRSANPPNTRVALSVNLHYREERIPSGQQLQIALEELWDEAHALVGRLDQLGN